MAATFNRLFPGRVIDAAHLFQAPAAARLVCAWRRTADGALMREWRRIDVRRSDAA
jgi:hypothetical protein